MQQTGFVALMGALRYACRRRSFRRPFTSQKGFTVKFQVLDSSKLETVAAAFFVQAWRACAGETGLGFMQARQELDEHKVLELINIQVYNEPERRFYRADYLAGRMVKTRLITNSSDCSIEVDSHAPNPNYQGWASGIPQDPGVLRSYKPGDKYASHAEMLMAAAKRVGVELAEIADVPA